MKREKNHNITLDLTTNFIKFELSEEMHASDEHFNSDK